MGKEVMGKKENEMAQEKERPAGSQSLFRGLMLIEILSNYPNGCPLAHLSELAGLNKSTVHRLLQGLQSCGYVTTAPAAGSYRLTTKFIAVGQKALSSLNIIHIAAPHLEALNIATGETINFSSREDDHAILIYKLEPTTGMLRTRAYIGQHMPLYCSAMGKIYMAFGHPDYVKSYWESHQHEIQPLTRNTITSCPRCSTNWRTFVKAERRWTEKKTNSASPVLLFRCLIFMGGCRTPCRFRFRHHV